jgi:hypothetical protein
MVGRRSRHFAFTDRGVGAHRLEDSLADKLRDLRDYGVSELLIAVYPSGYPMTCSAVSGTGYRWPRTRLHQSCQLFRSGLATPRLGDVLPPLNAVALGVGHNPNSVAKLSGTNVGSWYAMPFSIIPDRGQVSENSAKSPSKQSCDVFHLDDCGSKLANQSGVFTPKPAACAVKTRATTCETDILTWESSNNCVGLNPVSTQSVGAKASNIIILGNPRIALRKDSAGLFVDLAERHGLETACTLEA